MAATQISDLQSIYKSQYKINRNASIRPQRPKSFSIYTDYPPWGPSLPINPKGKSPNLTKMAATLVSGPQRRVWPGRARCMQAQEPKDVLAQTCKGQGNLVGPTGPRRAQVA